MANQIIIDIGAVANDGTGDPLRTAFGYVNNNFSNIWATGVANSNIQFDGNKILTTNTNGNLVLAPNGIGKVQANVDIVPNANNTLSLGSLTRQWNTVYAQNLAVGGDTTFNNLTVEGNLTVDGDIIQIGNLVTDAKTIQLANTASTTTAANGSGITVGANDNIATMLYSSTSNTWTMNIGANVTGNVTAPYFIGNGSLLTGIASPYGNANVAAYLPTYTGNLSAGNLSVSSSGDTWTIEGQTITAPGGAIWYSNPDQNTDDFISAPGSNIRIQALNNSNVVEGQFSLTSASASLFVNNGLIRTWNFNESGNTEFPGCLIPLGAGGVCGNIGNLTNPWSNAYISGNISAGNISLTGQVTSNLIPVGNNTQTLGNATNRWSNLYLSGNTIYLGNLSLSAGADGLTSTAGFDLGNSVATEITANVLSANAVNIGTGGIGIGDDNFLVIETLVPGGLRPSNDDMYLLGNVDYRWSEVHANVYYGDGSQLTGVNLTANIIANGNTSVVIPSLDGPAEVIVDGNTWSFGTDGSTVFPTLTVTRGDRSGTLTGSTIRIGDGSQEAILTTPDGVDGSDSQRLVINPGAGSEFGEGGDIYLYSGRGGASGGSGGDIKIRGGLAPADGVGGYLDIKGGDTQGTGSGGDVDIQGGESGAAAGGDLNFQGGYGPTAGGDVYVNGGQSGSGNGGNVTITGGAGGNGVPTYGNVNIGAGGNTWTFNNTGNLVLPNDGVIYETNIPFGGLSGKTIALKPYGGTDADQQLLVYPTAGADANHLHLTTGNLWNTELFLGNDNLYVKLANTGDIVINTNDDAGNTAQWTFGTAGTILNSGTLALQVASGIPTSVADWNGQGGWNQSLYSNLATTGGTGTGLTVDVAAGGSGYIDINQITINTPGTGYTAGDVITIDNENNLPGTFVIGVSTPAWEFDTTGALTLPTIATPGVDTVEKAQISGTRKIIGETGTWSTYINGHSAFGNVAWTASSSTIQSAKITFVVQSNGTAFNWEQFDVAVCQLDSANAFVSVSGRIRQNSAIAYTEVFGYVSDGTLEVWLNPADGQTAAYINYDAVEFNIMPD
jgi:hypothetical protein